MSLGNTKLIKYGIKEEQSDLRIHVCPYVKMIYVYPTINGIEAINTGKFKEVSVYTKGIITAKGFIIPPGKIKNSKEYEIKDKFWDKHKFYQEDTTHEKGKKAQSLVAELLQRGELSLPFDPRIIENVKLQYQGIDIIVIANIRIQIKCDFKGGAKEKDGTGNLFVQTMECNPWGFH